MTTIETLACEDRIDETFSIEVGCFVVSLTYDFATRVGKIVLGDASSTDMSGAINLFRRIDPDVRLVETMAGDKASTAYQRRDDGRWIAIGRRHTARGEVSWVGEPCTIPWTSALGRKPPLDLEPGISDDRSFRQFRAGKRTPGL